jgi:hypothetical protein
MLALAASTSAIAQDTRTVTEPKIPAFCASLDAHLTSVNDGKFNTLAPADESKPDTDRIQKAIDHLRQRARSRASGTRREPTPSSAARCNFAKASRSSSTRASPSLRRSIPPLMETASGKLRMVDTHPAAAASRSSPSTHVSGAA